MTRDQLLWLKLAEEAVESLQAIAHITSKIMQLGPMHVVPEQQHTNVERLLTEISDFDAVVTLLEIKGLIPKRTVEQRQEATLAKWAKLELWAQESERLGYVTPDLAYDIPCACLNDSTGTCPVHSRTK